MKNKLNVERVLTAYINTAILRGYAEEAIGEEILLIINAVENSQC